MKRQIIKIDENTCNGCGLCAGACHEGAIEIVNGKARLIRDDYCDGLGNCLPVCPTGAITFEEREAAAYDEEAVLMRQAAGSQGPAEAQGLAESRQNPGPECFTHAVGHGGGCPGSRMQTMTRQNPGQQAGVPAPAADGTLNSELQQWPVQIKLVPVHAPWFDGANLLIAADCTAYAYARFHRDFIRNRIAIIGCPKLDAGDYTEKLTAILAENTIKSLTIVRMEVPCCGGLAHAATEALKASGKFIPWQIVTISTRGEIL